MFNQLQTFPSYVRTCIYVIDVILKFESPKKKPTNFLKIMPPSKTFKNICFWTQINWKKKQNCKSCGLMKIWSDFKHSKKF
jgi:hypothetical protein